MAQGPTRLCTHLLTEPGPALGPKLRPFSDNARPAAEEPLSIVSVR